MLIRELCLYSCSYSLALRDILKEIFLVESFILIYFLDFFVSVFFKKMKYLSPTFFSKYFARDTSPTLAASVLPHYFVIF